MFEILLPLLPFLYVFVIGVGPVPDDAIQPTATQIEARAPEPQIPTGKFTTTVEVKPILSMTKGNWVAVRNYEGQDLLYFSHLLAWRCGLWDVRYGINGAAADQEVALEPCHEDTATPNAIVDVLTYPIYVTLPENSVETVYIELTFDDGTTDFAQFNRNEIQIP